MSFSGLRELSLAGAIIRALRLGFVILGNSFEIHSEHSLLTQPELLEPCSILPALASLYSELKPSTEATNQDKSSEVLQDLATKMSRVVGDLIVHLERSQENEAKSTPWNEERLILQQIWKKEDIHALEQRLVWFKDMLNNVVIPALKSDIKIQRHITQTDEAKSTDIEMMRQILSGKSSILPEDNRYSITATEGTSERKQHVQINPINHSAQDKAALEHVDKETSDTVAQGEEQLSTDHTAIIEDFILESLVFSAMKDREEQVIEAHTNTLDWLFSESKHGRSAAHFPTWLRGKDSIFWVNGKAGSGKSTLMRFIGNHKRTVENLQVWAGEKKLTTAGFYFWTSGSLEQRSQVGLLRYLLFQLLQEHRHLIRITFPRTWKHYLHSSTKDRIKAKITWGLVELMEGFNLFLQRALARVKICLFIDGLDEFEGDHKEIINLFKALPNISDGNLKICLSSRPWSTFERAFSSVPTFRLQELTFYDMVEYVTDKFREDPRLRKMLQDEASDSGKLVMEIVKRADGVFLWVTLVVRSLINDFEDSNRVIDVKRRLLVLPTNLDQFFQHTLFEIQPGPSIEQASRIFQLIRAREIVCDFTGDMTSTSLTLWELALALEDDMKLATETEIHQASDEETLGRCRDTQSLIQSSCAGLLRINPPTRHNYRE
ncbi:MAG: hypothetical protein Q9167_006209, partial [Letrouitia subvulpina]